MNAIRDVNHPSTATVTDDASLSTKVVAEIAAAKGVSPLDMHPPLYETIDPEALDSLFAEHRGRSRSGTVSFRYDCFTVTVESTGRVTVRDVDADDPRTQ